MEVEVPKAVHVLDLERAHLARCPRLGSGCFFSASATFLLTQQPLSPHEPRHGAVGGHRLKRRIRVGDSAQIVVVQLKRPAWMLTVKQLDRASQRLAERRLRTRVLVHLASQGSDRIVPTTFGLIEPALQGRESEPNALAGRRVRPGARR